MADQGQTLTRTNLTATNVEGTLPHVRTYLHVNTSRARWVLGFHIIFYPLLRLDYWWHKQNQPQSCFIYGTGRFWLLTTEMEGFDLEKRPSLVGGNIRPRLLADTRCSCSVAPDAFVYKN